MTNNIEHLSLSVKEKSACVIWLGESTFFSGPYHEGIFSFAAKSIQRKTTESIRGMNCFPILIDLFHCFKFQ